MSDAIRNVTLIRNTRTGETGTFIATWTNFAGQQVVNVRIGRMWTSWNTAEAAVL